MAEYTGCYALELEEVTILEVVRVTWTPSVGLKVKQVVNKQLCSTTVCKTNLEAIVSLLS